MKLSLSDVVENDVYFVVDRAKIIPLDFVLPVSLLLPVLFDVQTVLEKE